MTDRTLPQLPQIGRLAMRVEGDLWVGYYALPDTMGRAIRLGSILMVFVATPERKEAFMEMMREAVGDIIEEKTGNRPVWGGPTPGPQHERAGRA